MGTGIEDDLKRICVKIIEILRWVQTSKPSSIQHFPDIVNTLVDYIKEMYAKGGDGLEPGGLCALTTLQNSTLSSGMSLDRQHQLGNEVIEGTLKCFAENLRGPLLVTLNVELCRSHLCGMTDATCKNEATIICKKVLDTVGFIVNHYSGHCKNQAKTSTILLCLNQIKTCLPLFLVGFEEDCSLVQKYAANCLMECLDRIKEESFQATVLSCSEFIDLMDSALNLLDDLIENTREWMADFQDRALKLKEIIDELLCHSMSTAQVAATDEDKQAILNKSQKILHCMETLKDDLAGEDMSSAILAAHTVSDALCALERAVNSAVLRLVLQVNSGLEDPLRELVDMCRPGVDVSESKGIRRASDLDDGTAKFDAYLDKLMQIGTFAVSCSSNVKKAMQLRSCLASFESLEAELIPSVTAIYLDPSRSNKKNLRIFIEHWIKECQKFRSVLDTIVDPAAFLDVVRESLNMYFAQLETSEDRSRVLSNMVKISKTLNGILETSIHQDCAENVSEMTLLARKVSQCIENCERVYHKLRAIDGNVPVNVISKRAQSLIESVEKVWDYLAQRIAETDSSNLDVDPLISQKLLLPTQKNYYQLCPTDCETPSNTLEPLIAKGKLLMKEAILYNTPKRCTNQRLQTPVVPTTARKSRLASVARSRCFRSTAKAQQEQDMELTALLEDISQLDCTFSLNETLKPRKDQEFHGRKLLDLFTGWDSLLEQTAETESVQQPGSTIGSSDTPERFQDLLAVDEKIEQLKKLKPN